MTEYGTFRIDTREKEDVVAMFLALQQELENKGKPAFNIEREQLASGDVVAGDICFERKEGGDFIGSICDGRMKSQAEKMYLNFEHIYYILVDDIWVNSNMNPRAVLGAQASLAVKYDTKFLHTQNNAGFAYLVYNIVKRHAEGQEFDPSKKVIKNYEVDDQYCLTNMLACTGIGFKRAGILAVACDNNMESAMAMTTDEMQDLPDFGKKSAEKVYKALHR